MSITPEILALMARMINQTQENKPLPNHSRWIEPKEIQENRRLEKKSRAKRLQAKRSRKANRKRGVK
jgi:hypothetical protein